MRTRLQREVARELRSAGKHPNAALSCLCREAGAEGMVLIRNEGGILPLGGGERISVFGRIQREYYKSGTGSGGKVRVPYVTNILDALREKETVTVNEKLASVYANFVAEHPFVHGQGWAQDPLCQQEMPLTEALVKEARAVSDVALVIIGRTSGEDQDNTATPGSYYLTEEEETMLSLVTAAFDRVCVVLNIGNLMDFTWLDRYPVGAVLLAWQGGMEGGDATADVLVGDAFPSGKLTDTVALTVDDYPAVAGFEQKKQIYAEDVYCGYRYFESFAPERVRYPFGFGLSYTSFSVETRGVTLRAAKEGHLIRVRVRVKNTGLLAGKEVVQVYLGAPMGKLGKPARVLAAFAKTKRLLPGAAQSLVLCLRLEDFASYDDSGVTGHRSAWLLEAGQYRIYVGTDVRTAAEMASFEVPEVLVGQCEEALSPVQSFDRLIRTPDGGRATAPVPTRSYDLAARIAARRPQELTPAGKHMLAEVRDGSASAEAYIAGFEDADLCRLVCGLGPHVPLGAPGNCGVFGGASRALYESGMPLASTANGPSGLRVDIDYCTTCVPNGTMLGCTWNPALIERIYGLVGVEMAAYDVDILLGPGVNLHRCPLCGRNFEYFSEDPYLTGVMAVAVARGVRSAGGDVAIKHFVCNEREDHRSWLDSVVSERAARELYLKPFEMAVKDGATRTVMTSYNMVNGLHASSNYDLCTTILRREWGFRGIVMTDWWALENRDGETESKVRLSLMVPTGNDVFMCAEKPAEMVEELLTALREGRLTRGELQAACVRLARYLATCPAYDALARVRAEGGEVPYMLESEAGEALDAAGIHEKYGL